MGGRSSVGTSKGEVVVGDRPVDADGELFDQVGVEPLLGGDAVGGVVEVDAFPAGNDAGAFGQIAA
jgi:hypothetical protein